MNDLDLVGFREPFLRLYTQGMIYTLGAKMSKSKGNVVDAGRARRRLRRGRLRLYILFMGPADEDAEWQDTGIEGASRFLHRLWRLVAELGETVRGACPRRPARPQGARDDRQGHGRHRAALPVQHADRRGDGARQRDRPRHPAQTGSALRDARRRSSDPALRAAHRRGAVGAPRPRPSLGGALAKGRSGPACVKPSSSSSRSTARCATGSSSRSISRRTSSSSARRSAASPASQLDGKKIRRAIVVPGSSSTSSCKSAQPCAGSARGERSARPS